MNLLEIHMNTSKLILIKMECLIRNLLCKTMLHFMPLYPGSLCCCLPYLGGREMLELSATKQGMINSLLRNIERDVRDRSCSGKGGKHKFFTKLELFLIKFIKPKHFKTYIPKSDTLLKSWVKNTISLEVMG